jgi:hypothetical protein
VLVRMHSKVDEVYQMLSFRRFFNIKTNLEEAVSFFTQNGKVIQAGPFPKIFKCHIYLKKLRESRSVRFRCPECRTILSIDNNGQVFFG